MFGTIEEIYEIKSVVYILNHNSKDKMSTSNTSRVLTIDDVDLESVLSIWF